MIDLVEIIGILAGVFVLSSFLMKGEVKIRAVNIIGALLFVVYAVLIKSLSVGIINGILVFVQLIYLLKEKSKNDFNHRNK